MSAISTAECPIRGHERGGTVGGGGVGAGGATTPRSGDLTVVPNEELHARLLEAGVRCSVRGGGIRFSPHHYNAVEEINGALDVIRSAPA